MTSLDDTIISKGNLLLLDNITNYARPAIDYFTHNFGDQGIAIPWRLLLKMKNHKLIRLPSCSSEDDSDYHFYLTRLHHALWRRWTQQLYGIKGRTDPKRIDWDRDSDMMVLYGPDLTESDSVDSEDGKTEGQEVQEEQEEQEEGYGDEEDFGSLEVSWEDDDASVCSSSRSSSMSSIFEHVPKSLRFSETVLRRDIDSMGLYYESHIMMKKPKTGRRSRDYGAGGWV